jgi:nucleoid-associated protein YgaU
MIDPHFYTADSLVNTYTGNVKHYVVRPVWKVASYRTYTVQSGDTLYSLAEQIFGKGNAFNWTIISDINFVRFPDQLTPGEEIKLPLVIIKNSSKRRANYDEVTSTTKVL